MSTAEKVSRYVVASSKTYRDASGVRVRLLYATRTSRLVAVDPATAEAVVRGRPEQVNPNLRPQLRDARVVVPADDDEQALVLDRNRRAAQDRSHVHLALLPTRYCNMGCAYCGQEHTRGALTGDHRSLVRARVLRAIGAPATKSARIDWFGAEPLMGYAVIKELAPQFVAAAGERGVAYSSVLVTNGSLLTPRKADDLARKYGVTMFEITVDGPPEVHDRHRPLKSGHDSFWKIARTVQEALEQTSDTDAVFSFRTNVDIHNQESIPRYIELMAELGFAHPRVRFSIVPVHSWGNDVTEVEVGKRDFAARETQWLTLLQQHGLTTSMLPTAPAKVVCPAVTTSSELISGTGNIFSCSEYPLVPEAERTLPLAHITDANLDVQRPIGPFDDWNDQIAGGSFGCSSCVFMPTCGGACPKAWIEGHPPCPSYKFNVQDRLDLIAQGCGLEPVAQGRVEVPCP